MMRCGWCGRINIAAGETHTVPQSSAGRTFGRGGSRTCEGYTTYVALGAERVSAERKG